MGRTFLLAVTLSAVVMATSVSAQNAIRCEVNGKAVYGDSACAPGSVGKAIAPTQETVEQKAAGKAASDQIRKDTAYVDKRLDDRYKRDTARRAVVDVSMKDKTVVDSKAKQKRNGVKAKKSKKSAKKAAVKASKKDNRSYRPAPKA
jgi:hypothetical protein